MIATLSRDEIEINFIWVKGNSLMVVIDVNHFNKTVILEDVGTKARQRNVWNSLLTSGFKLEKYPKMLLTEEMRVREDDTVYLLKDVLKRYGNLTL